jgi:cytochrome c oxidase subunit 2
MSGLQSVLHARGAQAQSILELTAILMVGAAVIFVAVVVFGVLAAWAPDGWRKWLASERTIIVGGIVFPAVTLSALLLYELVGVRHAQGDTDAELGEPSVRIEVEGNQWWWRVRYDGDDARGIREFETANELRLPVGETVELRLISADVIHSFWVPSLAGKLDMIPGRTNTMRLRADVPGVFRGQCAEYCGGAHAWMALYTVAVPPDEFAAWRAEQAQPAREPDDEALARGRTVFLGNGCVLCHTIRGTPALGSVGPDLTHVGGRLSLAAGLLPNHVGTLAGWIASSQHLKPENRMPSFTTLAGADLRALAGYLESLK